MKEGKIREKIISIVIGILAAILLYEDTKWSIMRLPFILYLLVCTKEDFDTRSVYRFWHYMAGGIGIVFLCSKDVSIETIIILVVYIMIQLIICRAFIGVADGFVFIVSALYFGVCMEGELIVYIILHIILAFLLLLLMHIDEMDWKRGKIKEPKPFIPYITVTAMILLFC